MERAEIKAPLTFEGYPEISGGIVAWPMSVIRLRSASKESLVSLSDKILAAWREYTDESACVLAYTDGVPHNTITPIARRRGEDFELDLVLRNNLCTEEFPMGVYHPHADKHNIKKENIGLIEVMGLAVLPARLEKEIALLADKVAAGATDAEIRADEVLAKHADWLAAFRGKYTFTADNAADIIRAEVGETFVHVLEDAGVYKDTEAMLRFTASIGAKA
jgi:UDPglucose--hexose-1-phosphate uridylyltransferase